MQISEIRKKNLKAAITIAGSSQKLGELSNTSQNYFYQCLSANNKKQLGNIVARRIEVALGFDKGWMDTVHTDNQETEVNEDNKDYLTSINLLIDQLTEEERRDLSEVMYLMIRKRDLLNKYEKPDDK